MAHHKACQKQIRKSTEQRSRNRAVKSTIKTMVKNFKQADGEKKQDLSKDIASFADRAKRRGIINKRKSARIKSRVQKQANAAN